VQIAGQTVVLMLPYPLRGFRYDIAWTPPDGPAVSEAARAVWSDGVADSIGIKLAEACVAAFAATPWHDRVNVAAYMPVANLEPSHRYHRRIGLAGYRQGHDIAPAYIDLRTASSHYRAAWWDEAVTLSARAGDSIPERLKDGLLMHEYVVSYLPVRLPDDSGSPVAILRVGLSPEQALPEKEIPPPLKRALAQAHAQAISCLS
jgi:hypothetical protein